jgi:uncharacterized protein (DUF58 family)
VKRVGRVRRTLRWIRRRFRPPRRLSFTREGRLVTLLAIGVGLAAVNTGNNLLYLLLGWLLSFIVASGVLSEGTMRGLSVTRRPPPRIHAGQPFLMEVAVANAKPKRASYSIEIEDLIAGVPLDKKCYFLKIPPGRTQRTSYRHTFLRRGAYTIDGVRIATKFPFALFRKSRDVKAVTELVVFPALVPVTPPPPRAPTRGDAIASRIGRRGEFFGLREHRRGDDRRDIHWKSSARTGRLLVREYEDELAREVTIAVDNALPAATRQAVDDDRVAPQHQDDLDALERAISMAASLACGYIAVGWQVTVVARGGMVPASGGRAHEARVLTFLALLPAVADDVPMESAPSRAESVLVVPRGVAANGRPSMGSTVDA